MNTLLQYRFVPVIALLAIAAALLRDRNRLPIALRGISRVAGGQRSPERPRAVSRLRRTVAFLLVMLAFALAVWGA